MPWVGRKLSTVVKNLQLQARIEHRRAIMDIGKKALELARANAPESLRKEITLVGPIISAYAIGCEIGSESPIVRWLEEGTGIYGPTGQRIRPRTALALAWPMDRTKGSMKIATPMRKGVPVRGGRAPKGLIGAQYTNLIVRRSVRGQPARWMIRNAVKSRELDAYRRKRMAEMQRAIAAKARP